MERFCSFAVLVCLLAGVAQYSESQPLPFRPPAVPLVVVDPYLSIWSMTDNLYDDVPKHWSGRDVGLTGMIRIDGKVYRFMSSGSDIAEDTVTQVNLIVIENTEQVHPTQTMYYFKKDGVALTVTFSTPAFLNSKEIPYLPTTHITFEVASDDNKTHNVQIYYDNTAEGVVSDTANDVIWSRHGGIPGRSTMRIEAHKHDYLSSADMINWGYWYVNTIFTEGVETSMGAASSVRGAFMEGKPLPIDEKSHPRPCSQNWPVLAVSFDIGAVSSSQPVARFVQILYDQVYSIRFYGTAFMPLWRHLLKNDIQQLIDRTQHDEVVQNCSRFDNTIYNMLTNIGGYKYADICSLAWRQAVGGTIAVWNNVTKQEWMFLKEISSDGDASTVDVIFPASPMILATNPEALKLLLLPVMELANNSTEAYGLNTPCTTGCAPHDLGRYPVCAKECNYGQPLEETGNMLQMLAAVVELTDRNIDFLKPYWGLLKQWAEFSVSNLPSPPLQKCTDDFEGPSPNNVNLAAKGIVGLAAYTYLLRQNGQNSEADHYDTLNRGYVQYWLKNGLEDNHYKRQFDLKDTWSLKYNMLYHRVLGLKLFQPSVLETDMAFYQKKMNKYGIPLDDRNDYTKTDWLMWIAAMGNEEQFNAITDAVFQFANDTEDRVPFTDFYYTTTGKLRGFRARPVIGGLYARFLLSLLADNQ